MGVSKLLPGTVNNGGRGGGIILGNLIIMKKYLRYTLVVIVMIK